MPALIILAIAYTQSHFYRAFIAVLSPDLIADLGVSKEDLSLASGMWFAAFALMQFIVGMALDRFGPRKTTAIILAIFGAGGAFLFSIANDAPTIIFAMTLIGIGCSPILMGSLFVLAKTYDAARFALLSSIFIAVGLAGGWVGAGPLEWASRLYGWRTIMAGLAAFTFITALFIYVFVKEIPREESANGSGLGGYWQLLKTKALWPFYPIALLALAPLASIRGLWAGPILFDVYGADSITIGQVTSWLAIAMIVGTALYGPLDRIFGTRKWIFVAGTFLNGVAIAWFAFNPTISIAFLTALFICIGITGSGYGLLMAHAKAFFPEGLTGRGVTLINFFSIGGTGLAQFVTGRLVTLNETPEDPAFAYQVIFGYFAVTVLFSLVVYLFSKDVPPNSKA